MNIVEEIDKVKAEIYEECLKGHPQLSQIKIPQNLLLASLTFSCGMFGQPNKAILHSISCAVEMLNLAIDYHYYRGKDDKEIISNINLITGDFLYSRGIVFVSKLCDGFYVSCLTQSINDIVKAESRPKSFKDNGSVFNYLELKASLIKTSAYLGGLASGLEEEVVSTMSRMGKHFGMVYYLDIIFNQDLINEEIYKSSRNQLISNLKKDVQSLPGGESKEMLELFIWETIPEHSLFEG